MKETNYLLNSGQERGITLLMMQGEQTGAQPVDGIAGSETAQYARIGDAKPGEGKILRGAGILLSAADMFWIPQAALIAYVLSEMLKRFLDDAKGSVAGFAATDALWCILGICLIAFVRAGLQIFALNRARSTARQIQRSARADLLEAATACSPAAPFPSSGAFAAHLTDQVDHLGPYYRNFLPQVMRLKLVPVAIVLVTATVSWLAALILLICGPLIPVFMALIGMRAKAASAHQQDELTRLSGTLLDRIRGLETLTVFGAIGRTEDDIRQAGDDFRAGTMGVLKIAFLSSTVLELLAALGIAFVAVYVGFSLLGDIRAGTWAGPLSYWQGLFVLLLAPEFFAPLRGYAAAYHDRAAGLAAKEKLANIAQQISGSSVGSLQVSSSSGSERKLPENAPEIGFYKVSLSLGETPVLESLSFEVASGEILLLHGPSGSGKTTILDTLLGFHTPQSGRIELDGQRLVPGLAEQLRGNVIWLNQAPRLFHGSLKSNLLKGVSPGERVLEEDFWKALRLAGAADLVRRLPQGLATQLGEDGFGLSVGEMRRIALARAALRKDAVLLLADEPTAGLDQETASDVIAGLTALCSGRTSLIATHDPAVLSMPGRAFDMTKVQVVRSREVAE
ncbi:MAG: thiol reductant ABC exporter subunit CydD [Roseibium sp.]